MDTVQDKLYLDGSWQAPHGRDVIEVVSASTEEPLGQVPHADAGDVDAAVTAARRAFDDPAGWSRWEPERRAAALERLADELAACGDLLARTVSAQNGMPIAIGLVSEAITGPALLRYYAHLVRTQPPEERRPRLDGSGTTVVRREPVGVLAAIVPWNFPQVLTWFKLAPALAAGCTAVLKPSPETVLDAQLMASALSAAGLPPGVVNVVPGGRETGAALVAHPGVDKVSFTGSTAAGRAVGEVCGRLLRPVTLELGGKSAAVVLDDADLGSCAAQLFASTLLNNGQTCYLSTRVLAPRSRYGEVVELIAALAEGLRVGDPLDPKTQVGPVATSAHRERVEGFIRGARDDGARLVAGGGRPAGLDRGWYVQPTVFADVDNRSRLAQEEVFGPVLAVTPYEDEEEAVRLANDSAYGLGGTVWTADPDRGLELARRVRSGTLGVNGYQLDVGAPFGGVKDSGYGRELGPEGLAANQTFQSVFLFG